MVEMEMTDVCKNAHFDKKDCQNLIFVTEDRIYLFNFISEEN